MKSGRPNARKNLANPKRLPPPPNKKCPDLCEKCPRNCGGGKVGHRGKHICSEGH